MRTVRSACQLQPNALEIHVGDQIERLDQIIEETKGSEYFQKTFITEGMKTLLSRGIARLAGKSNDSIFHLKQAMGGGKTHLMVGFGLLAKDPLLRSEWIGMMPYQADFSIARIAAFNGRNNPHTYFWGEIARQLGKEALFREYWETGVKAPDEEAWLKLLAGDEPILILLDEMPPYFHYYSTQVLGQGTVADVITRAFSNLLTAAQKKKNVCIVISDLEAAYDIGGNLIQRALKDAKQEVGRAEINITPVNLESEEIYQILRKRLFQSLPDPGEISEIACVYANCLSEAAKAKTVNRSAESIANEIENTYPFHPSFQSIVALFKENEKFKQTRGLMELVSRLLKSVWQSSEDVYLIGAQHFDLSIGEVREKLSEISQMRDVIAKDLWNSMNSAHAQCIDLARGNNYAKQAGTLLLLASLSDAVNSVKGLLESEMMEYLVSPNYQASEYRLAFRELNKIAWYIHHTEERRIYFDHQENLTKRLQSYADKAPQNRIDDLIRHRLCEMYKPITKEAYDRVLALPEIEAAHAVLKNARALLIISPDGKTPPAVVTRFFAEVIHKNQVLVLTGDKTPMTSVEKVVRHLYATLKAENEISENHPQYKELQEKKKQYEKDFQSIVLTAFDKLLFPGNSQGKDILRFKTLNNNYSSNDPYNGEKQVIKTLTSDPIKLYTQALNNFDALKERAEQLLFSNQDEVRKIDLLERMKQNTKMPWLPPKEMDLIIQEAFQRGIWEDLGNGYLTRKPKPKKTRVVVFVDSEPDDSGTVRLKIDAVDAGNSPKIHYQEEGEVSKSSPVLMDKTLLTKALRVQFLAVDPTGKNETGMPTTWINKLILRNQFDSKARKVELFVAPKGTIRYTLDGSEPRNGKLYTEPIEIGKGFTNILAFAEWEGIETKRKFTFPEVGYEGISILRDKPAQLFSSSPKKLDSTIKTYEGLKIAKEKNIAFEQVTLLLGSAPQVIHLSLGEMKIEAEFLERELAHLKSLLAPDAPVVMQFRRVYTPTGYDLEQFSSALGIDIIQGEVVQE